MSETTDLAHLIEAFRAEGKRFVVMLGAGASMKSGVPDTRTMMKEVVEQYGTGISGRDIEDRFNQLMQMPEDNRRTMLKPYLDKKPSTGYRLLAELIRDGYFETVITFNFDTLLEKALRDIGVHDFTIIIRGEFEDSKIPKAVQEPGIKILKLHGSLKGVSNFIFSGEDLVEYPEPIKDTVKQLTAGNILVCGYAYGDQCVIASFSKDGSGNVVIVDPNPPQKLRDVATKRRSSWVFSGKAGHFDDFLAGLSTALKSEQHPPRGLALNPFKFLVAYRDEDRKRFFGREKLVQDVSASLLSDPQRALFIEGPSKVGKTSFVRAGVLPLLPEGKEHRQYVRCQADLEKWLPAELARRYEWEPVPDLTAALQKLAPPNGPRFYLLLDQFERVVRPFEQKPGGREDFRRFLERLMVLTPTTMTIVYIARESESNLFLSTLFSLRIPPKQCFPINCDASTIADVIGKLAALVDEEVGFDPAIVERLQKEHDEAKEGPFTLAHVSAVCHLLCDEGKLDVPTLDRVLAENRESLNRMINEYDIIGFIEDIPFDAEARALLARMIKVVSKEGRQNLAECLTTHFAELFPALGHGKEKGHAVGIN